MPSFAWRKSWRYAVAAVIGYAAHDPSIGSLVLTLLNGL